MKTLITISREFGSGGLQVGQKVAKELGYAFYDQELISLSAKESGLSEEYIQKNEQNIASSWLYNLLLGTSYAGTSAGMISQPMNTHNPVLPLADQLFNAQRKTILALAKKGPCVIVGRCADYILSTSEEFDKKDILNVFVYADLEAKIQRAIKEYGINEKDARKTVLQVDKRRANHYNTFTENIWGDRRNYDLLVNTSSVPLDGIANMIIDVIRHS